MHKPPLGPLIYATLFPNPKPTDPPNFQTHISKQLVPEVRAETARFYGHIDCVEAQYPGLDYALAAHRLRLSRFSHHRRLFQAFDVLRFTDYEIQTLCKWEGTRWARERYEKDIGVRVRETTWDDVVLAIPEPPTVTRTPLRRRNHSTRTTQNAYQREIGSTNEKDAVDILAQSVPDQTQHRPDHGEEEEEEEEGMEDEEPDESEDELQQSVGVELNQRLMAATEARNRGEEAVLDPDWEQWLKEAERGAVPDVTVANTAQAFATSSTTWPQQVPGIFGTEGPITMPAPASSTLEGPSAPPAGTAM
ncbi:MAG: hypothetical protein Q9201_001227 [Fulgogasparrea decipioides]